jgi:hypothetical protein
MYTTVFRQDNPIDIYIISRHIAKWMYKKKSK